MSNKTYNLNLSERIYAIGMLNEAKGTHELLALVYKDLPNFTILDEDWEKAERKVSEPDKEGNVTWTWNDEKGGDKPIELHKEVAKYILEKLEDKSKKGEFTLKDRAAISLIEKLS